MIETTKLPNELVSGRQELRSLFPMEFTVEKCTLTGIDEIQWVKLTPWTTLNTHGHDENQWEVWLNIFSREKEAYICMKGEQHKLVNNSCLETVILAIKGHSDYSYDELAKFFEDARFSVSHGSMIIED